MLLLPSKEALLKQVSSKFEKEVKKLVSVLATFRLVTGTREKVVEIAEIGKTAKAVKTARTGKDGEESKDKYLENLVRVPCIRYPITFRKKSVLMLVLFDLSSEFNAIYLTFAQELGLSIKPTDVRVQKIGGTTLDTFGIVVIAFLIIDKVNRIKFFKKTFFIANVSPKIVFEMLFLTLNDANVNFLGQKFW